VSATLDGRKSEQDARAATRQFRNAVYVTVDGASHDILFRRESQTILPPAIEAFLRSERIIPERRLSLPIQFGHE